MKTRAHVPTFGDFVTAGIVFLFLVFACLFGVWLLFGGSGSSLAHFEADRLSTAEVSELVGTTSYLKEDQPAAKSIADLTARVLHLPFADPLALMEHELPTELVSDAPGAQTETSLFTSSIGSWASTNKKIALGWIQATTVSASEQIISSNNGLTVVSPTWLKLADPQGHLSGTMQPEVVQFAHDRHISVWVMVDNQFNQSMTHQFLTNPTAEQTFETGVVSQATSAHVDGINLDFENLDPNDRTRFTQFVSHLHDVCQAHHLDLSVDITQDIVPLQDDGAYFHAALAGVSDQVILMAYDEHYGGDETPGPVADSPWVEQGVDDLLNTGVPADKIVLGMPFYTRFWYIHTNGSVTSEAVSESSVADILTEHHATPTWNGTLDLMYASYAKPDGTMEVWYQSATSIADKLNLVNQDGLGGVGVWSLDFSNPDRWSSFINALRQTVS